MTLADKASIMSILRDTPEFKDFEVDVAEEVIDAYLDDPCCSGYYVLVAESGSDLVGYICYGPAPGTLGTWDIYWQAVARARQGQGIGAALTKGTEIEIRKAGGRLAVIETSGTPLYEKTVRFHSAQGYKTVACVPEYYAPGDDKLIMVKRMDNAVR